MGTWNHRVIKRPDSVDEWYYCIHEVYYDEDGSVYLWTENGVRAGSDSVEGVKEFLGLMLEACNKPVLVEQDGKLISD